MSVYRLQDLDHASLLRGRYPTTPPRVAIEIRSPDDDPDDQAAKCRFYVDEWDCPLALLVDPESAVAEVAAYQPHVPVRLYREHERIEALYDLYGLELTPRALWTEADL